MPVRLGKSENHIGSVGGDSVLISIVPIVSAALYAAANNVGGLMRLPGAMRKPNGTGLWQALTIVERGTQKAPLDILLFGQAPNASYIDKSAMPTISVLDNLTVLHRISIAATDYVTVGGSSYASPASLNRLVAASANQSGLFAVAQIATGGAPTYVTANDLQFNFFFIRD